ncbi:MAG: transcription termination/antitermination protein NusA [Candidatus Omnitrophica bacterium CG12_big_fil_rev_8_21_14_0_65_43_15]|uniref:Transcription termination/antitermination protein NusA n=1 Tax=Candidatus Taenaricola geysiri TaxID=1974752 RepID=A0A2J0LH34_9BACT|nr:MAG: transcription termination/antitermination protein NusA [Candidatus Omnitrophica bacterium CG12_big_fil_rev_8_21_14_0_65_43_15]
MNGELLTVLDHIEREKGIKKEILINAVETALISAARKMLGHDIKDDITVKLNPETGDIKVFQGKKKIDSDEFGRIAAQTAKQIIIQKIREAERDVIFSEYTAKIGTVISGSVHRFEKGDIVVDLGRTEAVLPKKEQISKETYKQGERVRAYVLDVKKTGRGPQIVLSRTHPGLVKRMFELEVPEIIEGIVEIKVIAREAGDRTKIAVWSKDLKVDCLGACVGMRGARVKEIVRELHGEKIDIVKWNEDPAEFIAAALSPAQINKIKIDKESKKVEVIVEEDQLSLAIGKKGQNVRLAVKLTGWDIDIKPRKQIENLLITTEPAKEPSSAEGTLIQELPRVGPKTYDALTAAGFNTVEKIAGASVKELSGIKGIGKKSAENLIESSKELLKGKK